MDSQIKLLATDVDGTLTDGGMYYSSSGQMAKKFHVRDGLGAQLLLAVGIQVAFISADSSPIIKQRAERLSISYCFSGVKDKVQVMQKLCADVGLSANQVAFLGDDIQDLAVMQYVGLPAAVGDAHYTVKEAARYTCRTSGGQGAFREFAEYLLEKRGISVFDAFKQYKMSNEEKKIEIGVSSLRKDNDFQND